MQTYRSFGLKIGAALALFTAMPACTSPAATSDGDAVTTSLNDSCINPLQIKKQKILSDQDIRFEMQNGDVWINHMEHRCAGLRSEQGFEWSLHGNRVCSNQEIIHVLNDGGSCALGEFRKQPPTPA